MYNKGKRAFTLVELVVAVVILSILATVGFVSYASYISGSRDTNRIVQVNNAVKQLQTTGLMKQYPLPTSSIELRSSGTLIGHQGVFGQNVQEQIGASSVFDPLDKSYFTYSVNPARKRLQMTTYLESNAESKFGSFPSQGLDSRYANRYPYVIGDGVGMYRDDTSMLPVHEVSANMSAGFIDLNSSSSIYSVYLPDGDSATGTGGYIVAYVRGNPSSVQAPVPSRYPGCDTDDITIGSYTIAACNVGTTTASTDWTISRGSYFQWGRNKSFAYNDSTQQSTQIAGSVGLNASSDTFGFVWNSSLPSSFTWANTSIDNNWGGTSGDNASRQGPCAPGYRVPTLADWQGLVTAGGWASNGNSMRDALELPFAGSRRWDNGAWIYGGSLGFYWSSTPVADVTHFLYFSSSNIYPSNTVNRAHGYSVRCFKN